MRSYGPSWTFAAESETDRCCSQRRPSERRDTTPRDGTLHRRGLRARPPGREWFAPQTHLVLSAPCFVTRVFAGLVVNDFNRNTTIGRNSFRKLGDSAILLIGSAELLDATGGDQPRFTTIESNTAYEYGLLGKQVAAVFQAVSCQTLIRDNIFFSGPRHGVNFNGAPHRLRTLSAPAEFTVAGAAQTAWAGATGSSAICSSTRCARAATPGRSTVRRMIVLLLSAHHCSLADASLSSMGPHDIRHRRSRRHALCLEGLGRDRPQPCLQQLPIDVANW